MNYFRVEKNYYECKKAEEKTIVFITFQYTGTGVLKDKLYKLCQIFELRTFPFPDNVQALDRELAKMFIENNDANQVFKQTQSNLIE